MQKTERSENKFECTLNLFEWNFSGAESKWQWQRYREKPAALRVYRVNGWVRSVMCNGSIFNGAKTNPWLVTALWTWNEPEVKTLHTPTRVQSSSNVERSFSTYSFIIQIDYFCIAIISFSSKLIFI